MKVKTRQREEPGHTISLHKKQLLKSDFCYK